MSRRIPHWLVKLALLGSSVMVGFVLCEIMVRIMAPQNLFGTWFTSTERGLRVNRARWQAQHQCGDVTVFYRINEHHLRGTPLGNEAFRVLCLGDSFTFGALLPEQDTYVERLNRLAEHFFPGRSMRFLNGGCGGWGTADYVAFVEEYGHRISPKAIVVFLNTDDVQRSIKSHLYCKNSNGQGIQPLYPTHPPSRWKETINSSRFYNWLLYHCHALQLVRRIRKNWLSESSGAARPTIEDTEGCGQEAGYVPGAVVAHGSEQLAQSGIALEQSLFLRLRDWCITNNAKLFVTTTGYNAFAWTNLDLAAKVNPNAAFFRQAPQFFRNSQIPYQDLAPTLAKYRHDAVIIRGDGHPNSKGSKLIAESAWAWLKPELSAATMVQ